MKKVIAFFLVLVSLSGAISAMACNYHVGADLVDSGKNMDWDGSTKYSIEWTYAVSKWNELGKVTIRPDSGSVLQDVLISDYSNPASSIIAFTNPYGEICFNTAIMDTFTSDQRKKTVMHELGHALGLAHIEETYQIMKSGQITQTALGVKDKSAYHCIWP